MSVEAFDMDDATEEAAENLWSSADHFDAVTIHVQGGEGAREFRVSVDFEPRFDASEIGSDA